MKDTQPTPVSDLIVEQFRAGEAHSDGLILTLRDLELQLTAALAEIDRLDVAGIHSCHANCQKSMCVMRRELTAVTEQRDELAESLEFQFKLNRECIDQITTRTKERDEAREAAQKAKAYKRVLKETNAQLKRERDEAREAAQKAKAYKRVLKETNAQLKRERDEARGQRDRLAEALRECRDDSIELLGERDWWQRESRGDYQERYQAIRDNVTRADAALQSLNNNPSAESRR